MFVKQSYNEMTVINVWSQLASRQR